VKKKRKGIDLQQFSDFTRFINECKFILCKKIPLLHINSSLSLLLGTISNLQTKILKQQIPPLKILIEKLEKKLEKNKKLEGKFTEQENVLNKCLENINIGNKVYKKN